METVGELPVQGIFLILEFEKLQGFPLEFTGQPAEDPFVLIMGRVAFHNLFQIETQIISKTGAILKLFAKIH